MKKFKLSIVTLLMMFLFLFTACLNNKTENAEKTSSVVKADSNFLGAEYEVEGKVEVKALNSNYVITKYLADENKTIVAVTANNEIATGEELFELNQATVVTKKSQVLVEDFDNISLSVVKRAGEVLLGDFDADDEVGITDLTKFANNYLGTSSIYDIYPSTKGTGDWADIYCISNPDGNVDLKDFVVLGRNFGKVNPEAPEPPKGITIYLESNTAPDLYAWSTGTPSTPYLGEWPGKTLTDKDGVFYYYTFDEAVTKVNYIHFIGGKSGNLSTDVSVWITKDGKVNLSNPYGPSAPTVSVSPAGGEKKGTQEIQITISGDSITSMTASFAGKAVTIKEGTTTILLSDYLEDGKAGTLTVSATNSEGTDEITANFSRNDTIIVKESEFTWNNATIYFVINDRFYNGNTSNDNSYGRVKTDATGKNIGTFHGGDLAGLTQKMEYLKETGVTAIWFTAAYEQMHGWCAGGKSGDFAHYGYHGYYAIDWTSLDKNMGTIDEMKKFVDTAHENGIRVVMDIVMNHTGYPNLKDMDEYGYGATGKADWTPTDGNWNGMHDFIPYSSASSWTNWWGLWARAGIPGSAPEGTDELTKPLANLPDIVTEATSPIHSKFFEVKWGKEKSGYDNWIVSDSVRAKGPSQVPAEYIINSLAEWVETFGIDGFRCDTAKHIDMYRWKQLKDASKEALKKWRANNPTVAGADWTDDFWMTGEHWNFNAGGGGGDYYSNGFDNMIDFGFKGSVPMDASSMGSKWSAYASKGGKLLPYISSHDTGSVFYNGSESRQIAAGTGLLLTPGPVQIYYGDEIGRDNGDGGSDADQGSRSSFQWDKVGNNIYNHWSAIGRFRANNPAVGAGTQTDLGSNTYGRKWNDNKVVIKVGATGSTSVSVSGFFADGQSVRNAYNGETATVSGGKVTFTGENGVILIESAN